MSVPAEVPVVLATAWRRRRRETVALQSFVCWWLYC
jgi:hypothetical protein